jgi:hypothetical protein
VLLESPQLPVVYVPQPWYRHQVSWQLPPSSNRTLNALRAACDLLGPMVLSAAVTAAVVVVGVNHGGAWLSRQMSFVDRWGEAEFVAPEPEAYVPGGLTKSVRTVRFAKPEDDPAAAPAAPARPRFPVAGYALASVDANAGVDPKAGVVAKPAEIEIPPDWSKDLAEMDEVSQYLWEVYQRAPQKVDRSGDFTWKDPMAAKRISMSLPKYVIGGMDPDFREQLYHAGRAMDAEGVKWAILSAFRDDYRQGIASGIKASARNSLHGGSARTGGYGYGRAVDITNADGEADVVWDWIDDNGAKFGLHRPMRGYDPVHVQSIGDWRKLAATLRKNRIKTSQTRAPAPAAQTQASGSVVASAAQQSSQ